MRARGCPNLMGSRPEGNNNRARVNGLDNAAYIFLPLVSDTLDRAAEIKQKSVVRSVQISLKYLSLAITRSSCLDGRVEFVSASTSHVGKVRCLASRACEITQSHAEGRQRENQRFGWKTDLLPSDPLPTSRSSRPANATGKRDDKRASTCR